MAKFEKCKFGEIGQSFFCKRDGKIERQYVKTFKAEDDLVSGHMPSTKMYPLFQKSIHAGLICHRITIGRELVFACRQTSMSTSSAGRR